MDPRSLTGSAWCRSAHRLRPQVVSPAEPVVKSAASADLTKAKAWAEQGTAARSAKLSHLRPRYGHLDRTIDRGGARGKEQVPRHLTTSRRAVPPVHKDCPGGGPAHSWPDRGPLEIAVEWSFEWPRGATEPLRRRPPLGRHLADVP